MGSEISKILFVTSLKFELHSPCHTWSWFIIVRTISVIELVIIAIKRKSVVRLAVQNLDYQTTRICRKGLC